MRVTAKIQCPGCQIKTDCKFKNPSLLEATIFSYDCSGCESTVMVRAEKPKGFENAPKGQIRVRPKVTKPSKLLLDMLREEAEHNALSEGDTLQESEVTA